MPAGAALAIVVFAGMFAAWAVLPTFLKKRHEAKADKETGL